jgi:nitroreductase
MNVIDALNSRHSVRAFKPDPVAKETITKIVAGATRAPSWGNTQPWEIFVASGEPLERLRKAFLARFEQGQPIQPDLPRPPSWPPALRQRMAENAARRYTTLGMDPNDEKAKRDSNRRNFEFFDAPVMVYLCMDRTLAPWSIFDMGMAAQSLMLAAQEYGVDSVPAVNLVGYPDLIRAEVGIPISLMVLIGIALGYGDPTQPVNQYRSQRRPLDEVVRFIGF